MHSPNLKIIHRSFYVLINRPINEPTTKYNKPFFFLTSHQFMIEFFILNLILIEFFILYSFFNHSKFINPTNIKFEPYMEYFFSLVGSICKYKYVIYIVISYPKSQKPNLKRVKHLLVSSGIIRKYSKS